MTVSVQAVRLDPKMRQACKVCVMSDCNRMDCELVGEVLGYPKGVCIVSHEGRLEEFMGKGRMKGGRA